MDDAWFELNRAWWDERVATHVGSDFYGVERFLEGWSPLRPPDATFEHNDTVEWNHGLGAIVTALAAAGLRIESLVERPTLFMQRWPFQVEHGHQDWRNPPELPQIPLSFSLLAQKPVAS